MSFSNQIIVSLTTLLFFTFHLKGQELFLTEYTVQQGLPQEYIYTINQDSAGYLWIGTGNGLARFDGMSFETYTVKDSLADNFITCSQVDDGRIWFGHMNGNLSIYENGSFSKYKPHIPIEDKTAITSISRSPDGKVWASTFASGMILLNPSNTGSIYNISNPEFLIVSFYFTTDKDLLLGSTEGLYLGQVNAEGGIDIIRKYKDFPQDKIQSIIRGRTSKKIFVATQNEGVYIAHFNADKTWFEKIGASGNLPIDNLQQVLEDSKQNLWICTFGKGVLKTRFSEAGQLERISNTEEPALQKLKNPKCIFEDREGNLWVGNYGENLVRLKHQVFQFQSTQKNNCGEKIMSLYAGKQHRWIGTDKGLVKVDSETGKIEDFYCTEQGLSKGGVTSLYQSSKTELWIGTSQNGLYTLNLPTGKVQRYQYSIGKLENSITSITGAGEKIYVGTQKGVYEIQPQTGQKRRYTIQTGGLPHNTITHLYNDSENRLWIATPTAVLSYLENGDIKKIDLTPPTGGGMLLYSITEDKKGRIWVGSQGKGVFRIENDSILNLNTRAGLYSNFCYSIVCDKKGYIWVAHRNGLSRIQSNTLEIKSITNYNAGNINFDFSRNAAMVDGKNKVWFGTTKGLLSYNPELEGIKTPPPILNINSIKLNESLMDNCDKIVLPTGSYRLQVNFIGLSLKDPDIVKYQHILEGYDEEWSEPELGNTIIYPRLSSGKYTLKINATNGDGVTTYRPETISIIIKKPVWKRWWFYMIVAFFIGSWVLFYIKRREYKLNSEKRLLEKKVQERTAEIQRQKTEIETQRDLINKKNVDITDSIKYASKIQSAIIPSTDLLLTWVDDMFIINKPRDIVSGDFIWLAQKEGKLLLAVTDCTGHGVPGAIMSMLGITSLNEIVITQGNLEPNLILEQLRNKIISSLNPDNLDHPTYDGMSLSLCAIDFEKKCFEFSGAYNNMLYISDRQMKLLMADRIPIGVWQVDDGKYSKKKIDFKKGDVIYMFTDGYQDQFGGGNDKKFSSRRLRNLLHTIHLLPMSDQKRILEKTLEEWSEGNEQTDDITLMGIRF